MDTEFFRQLYRKNNGEYLIDTSKWRKKPNSIFYIDEDGNDYRTLPADKNNLQLKIAKEKRNAEAAVDNILEELDKIGKRLGKAKPGSKEQINAKVKETRALAKLKDAEKALQKFLIPIAQNVRADDPFVDYPIVPFVNYPKRLKKAATRTRQQFPEIADIIYINERGKLKLKPPKPVKTKVQKAREARERREKKKDDAIIAANDAVNAEFGRQRLTPARFQVEVSHKLRPKSKTTNIGRDYWRDRGYSGCISSIDDGRYSYLCNKLEQPKPRKRAAAGLSGAGTNMVNLPEYRRAINSLRN